MVFMRPLSLHPADNATDRPLELCKLSIERLMNESIGMPPRNGFSLSLANARAHLTRGKLTGLVLRYAYIENVDLQCDEKRV